jgi:hypothetical protein
LWKDLVNDECHVRVLSAVTYAANAESMVGSGTIYATNHYIHRQNKPRNDFVSVQLNDSDDAAQGSIELAQVLNFIEITNGNDERELYAFVAWLTAEEKSFVPKEINTTRGYASLEYFERYRYCRAELVLG